MLSGELGTLALGLVIAGVVSGLTAGMLGVGGGIVVVPVLYHVLSLIGVDESVRMHLAIGTSLATIIPTAFASVQAHNKKGAVDWTLLRRWLVPMLIGVAIGSVLAGYARGQTLSIVFVCVALPVAIHLAFGGEERRIADHLPEGPVGLTLPALIGGLVDHDGHRRRHHRRSGDDSVRRADPSRGRHGVGLRRDHLHSRNHRRGHHAAGACMDCRPIRSAM